MKDTMMIVAGILLIVGIATLRVLLVILVGIVRGLLHIVLFPLTIFQVVRGGNTTAGSLGKAVYVTTDDMFLRLEEQAMRTEMYAAGDDLIEKRLRKPKQATN